MNSLTRVVVIAVMTAVLSACGDPDITTLMSDARQARENGQYQDAVVALKNVLKQDPEHAEARYLLGVTALEGGDPAGAEDQLQRAMELGLPADRIQAPLARALFLQRKYEAVLERTSPDQAADTAGRVIVLAMHGRAELARGNIDAAATVLRQAQELSADSPVVLTALGRLAIRRGNHEEAADLAARAAEVASNEPEVRLLQADIAMRQGAFGKAEKLYRQLASDNPAALSAAERMRTRGALVEVLVRQEKLAAAQEEADKLVEEAPRSALANLLRGYVAYHQEDYAEAVEKLQVALSSAPEHPRALALMGAAKMQQGQTAQAKMYLNDAVAAAPGDVQSRALLASIAEETGQKLEASEIVSDGIAAAGDDPSALRVLGGIALRGGYLEEVVSNVRETGAVGQSGRLQAALGEALIGYGQPDRALELLSENTERDPESDVARRRLMVLAAGRSGDLDRALKEAQSFVDDYPENAVAATVLGAVRMAREEYAQARSAFERARDLAPEAAGPPRNLGLLALAQGNPAQARESFQAALDVSEGDVPAMLGMARAEHAAGNIEESVSWLRRIRKEDESAWQPRVVLGLYELEQGNAGEARTLAREAAEVAEDRSQVQALLGMSNLAAGETEAGLDALNKAVELNPESARLRYALGRARIASGDTQAALEVAQTLREQHDVPGLPALLEGFAHWADEDKEAAATAFTTALEAGRREAARPALAARQQAGVDDPPAPLEQWLESNPQDRPVRLVVAEWYAAQGQPARAVGHYETLVDQGFDPPQVLNNLAWLYHTQGNEQAAELAERALAAAPESAAVLDTAGWIAYHGGNVAEAAKRLSKAVDKAPQSREIRYHYAEVLAEQGKTDAALSQLQEILGDGASFASRGDAERLQQQLAN